MRAIFDSLVGLMGVGLVVVGLIFIACAAACHSSVNYPVVVPVPPSPAVRVETVSGFVELSGADSVTVCPFQKLDPTCRNFTRSTWNCKDESGDPLDPKVGMMVILTVVGSEIKQCSDPEPTRRQKLARFWRARADARAGA